MINTSDHYQRRQIPTWRFYANCYRISRYIISLFHSSITPREDMLRVMLGEAKKAYDDNAKIEYGTVGARPTTRPGRSRFSFVVFVRHTNKEI